MLELWDTAVLLYVALFFWRASQRLSVDAADLEIFKRQRQAVAKYSL